MKVMKLRSILLGTMTAVMIALSMTACSNDDDDNDSIRVATQAEKQTAFRNLTSKGTSGTARVYYFKGNNASIDSLKTDVQWRFTSDTTVVISGIPDSIFVSATSDASLRKAVTEGTPATTTITGYINYQMYKGQSYTFLNPIASEITINYQDKSQTFRPLFNVNSYFVGFNYENHLVFNMVCSVYRLGTTGQNVNSLGNLAISVIAK